MRSAISGCGSTNCACVYNSEMAREALDRRDAEITRLRARVEVLERVRGTAQLFIDTGFRLGWIEASRLMDELRAALEEAKP